MTPRLPRVELTEQWSSLRILPAVPLVVWARLRAPAPPLVLLLLTLRRRITSPTADVLPTIVIFCVNKWSAHRSPVRRFPPTIPPLRTPLGTPVPPVFCLYRPDDAGAIFSDDLQLCFCTDGRFSLTTAFWFLPIPRPLLYRRPFLPTAAFCTW